MKRKLCLIIALVILAGSISLFPTPASANGGAPARVLAESDSLTGDEQPDGTVLGVVLAESLTLWSEPYEGSDALDQREAGDTVYIFFQQGAFYYVQVPGTELLGYMLAELIEPEDVVPVEEPEPEPTEEPTPEPTEEPTPEPTEEPTPEPTEEPTPEPTEEPTPEPTEEPTPEPTEEPTPEPTEEPTPEPTEEPTPEPTEEPTPEPTEEPTPEPTEESTAKPTKEPKPTPEPTDEPLTTDDTPEPTLAPTAVPTAVPTAEPTAEPTFAPTSMPVVIPTAEPTDEPLTTDDTPEPTYAPTAEPTYAPTATPTPSGPYTEPTQQMIENAVDGVLTKSGVNMRKGPGTKYGLADSNLKSGLEVTVYLRDGDWYFLRVDKTGKYGYIYRDYVKLYEVEPTPSGPYTEPTQRMINNAVDGVLTKSGVNMRKGPSTKYGLVDSNLKSGSQLTVYAKDGDWYFLRVDKTGKYGYIHKDYVSLDDDDEPSPTKKATEEPSVRLSQGDVNGDGLVSAADAALILRYDAGIIDLSDVQLEAADMDGDDQVTSLDAKVLLRYVANRLAR